MERRKKILVVDDDPADLVIAARALRTPKPVRYDLVQAASTDEAASTLRVSEIDLIVLDLNLGDSQGVETVTRLRSRAGSTPIVVLTGAETEDTGLACIEAGAEDFLTKSAVREHLVRVVEFTLRRRKTATQRSNAALRSLLHEATPGVARGASARLGDQLRRVSIALSEPENDRSSALKELARTLVQDGTSPLELFRSMFDQDNEDDWPISYRVGLLAVHMAQAYCEQAQEQPGATSGSSA